MSHNHRVLHTHIFKEVMSPPESGRHSRLMVMEVDRFRNRQPEFFFNGIVGHVRSYDGGNINSWEQATQLANYWRRYYNIPEAHAEDLLGLPCGKTTRVHLTMLTTQLEPMRNSQNLTWKMLHLSRPRQATCRFQVRSTNWQQCFTTSS